MESYAPLPYILRLKGVKFNDYRLPEDLNEERLKESANIEASAPLVTTSLVAKNPPVFNSDSSWPLSTGLRCWNCTFSFDGPPRFIPMNVRQAWAGEGEQHAARFTCKVFGNFCTFNCAMTYVDTFPERKQHSLRVNIETMYSVINGVAVVHIKPSPPKTALKEYGGELEHEAYWEKVRLLDLKFGLRNHKPGSVVPERLRAVPRASGASVWALTGVRKGAAPPPKEAPPQLKETLQSPQPQLPQLKETLQPPQPQLPQPQPQPKEAQPKEAPPENSDSLDSFLGQYFD